MIPQNAIREWNKFAPWADPAQVEQDLIISRSLIHIYNDPYLAKAFAFRGGTALHKLFFEPSLRYSEDIDLVQLRPGPIGPALDALRKNLDPWLGEPRRGRKEERFTLVYHYQSETPPIQPMRLKIEVNTKENFSVFDLESRPLETRSLWFGGKTKILTYAIEELLGTKLRALYQRKKGRDLYDMAMALERFANLEPDKVIQCFDRYLDHEKTSISRAQFEANLSGKMKDPAFLEDLTPLLRPDSPAFNWQAAENAVRKLLIARLPGSPWKGDNHAGSKKSKQTK